MEFESGKWEAVASEKELFDPGSQFLVRVCGESGVGKSSLNCRLLGRTFEVSMRETLRHVQDHALYCFNEVENLSLALSFTDMAAGEYPLSPANLLLLVFNVGDPSTLDVAIDCASPSFECYDCILLVGTQADAYGPEERDEAIRACAQHLAAYPCIVGHVDVSAKYGTAIGFLVDTACNSLCGFPPDATPYQTHHLWQVVYATHKEFDPSVEFKVVLLGETGTGKSSILARLHTNTFDLLGRANYAYRESSNNNMFIMSTGPDRTLMQVSLEDSQGGQYDVPEGTDVIVLVYNITELWSLDEAPLASFGHTPVILVGSMLDSASQEQRVEATGVASQTGLANVLASAKFGTDIGFLVDAIGEAVSSIEAARGFSAGMDALGFGEGSAASDAPLL